MKTLYGIDEVYKIIKGPDAMEIDEPEGEINLAIPNSFGFHYSGHRNFLTTAFPPALHSKAEPKPASNLGISMPYPTAQFTADKHQCDFGSIARKLDHLSDNIVEFDYVNYYFSVRNDRIALLVTFNHLSCLSKSQPLMAKLQGVDATLEIGTLPRRHQSSDGRTNITEYDTIISEVIKNIVKKTHAYAKFPEPHQSVDDLCELTSARIVSHDYKNVDRTEIQILKCGLIAQVINDLHDALPIIDRTAGQSLQINVRQPLVPISSEYHQHINYVYVISSRLHPSHQNDKTQHRIKSSATTVHNSPVASPVSPSMCERNELPEQLQNHVSTFTYTPLLIWPNAVNGMKLGALSADSFLVDGN